jgi:hypothetical protein
MPRSDKPYVKILIVGTFVALSVLGLGFLFLNRSQCPENYTQPQVDASGCIVGANIGLGMVLLLSVAIQVVTLVLALVTFIAKRK